MKNLKLFEEFFYRKNYKYIPIIIDNVVYLFDIKSISKLPNDRFSKNDIIIKLHRYGYKEEREITVRYSGERDWFSIIDYKGIDNAKLSEKGEKILRRYLR
ncbi:MAG: hypothetical protein KDH96_13365 [Candidatus Riesia sp.]|nr:hypothetical protein [Candidatus Riesia sp.]